MEEISLSVCLLELWYVTLEESDKEKVSYTQGQVKVVIGLVASF